MSESSTLEPRLGFNATDEERWSELFSSLFPRARRAARKRLTTQPLRTADEEDMAISAFRHLYAAMAEGQLKSINGVDEGWRLLRVIVCNKVTDYQRRERAQKRGGNRIHNNSSFETTCECEHQDLEQVRDPASCVSTMIMFEDEKRRLLDELTDPVMRQIAVLKLEDHTNDEIAKLLGICVRTVERKIRLIRKAWWMELRR